MIEEGPLAFQTIAEQFKLIENDSKTIYIPLREGKALVQRLQAGERSRTLFRKLGQYGVSIYETEFKALADAGDILPVDSGKGEDLWVLANTSLYDERTGLSLEAGIWEGGLRVTENRDVLWDIPIPEYIHILAYISTHLVLQD